MRIDRENERETEDSVERHRKEQANNNNCIRVRHNVAASSIARRVTILKH